MSDVSPSHEFQYAGVRHQGETAISGMWLFLATEVLFFGVLFLAWIYCRHDDPQGFDAGARHTALLLGTINTVLLLTSSLVYAIGVARIEAGDVRWLIRCCAAAWLLGFAFMIVKFGLEWRDDFAEHLFPGARFGLTGPTRDGAQLFYVFYFVATGLHGLHLLVGLALVLWVIVQARRGAFTAHSHVAVFVVGLYWSFVDTVWIVLYPLIYLVGRGG